MFKQKFGLAHVKYALSNKIVAVRARPDSGNAPAGSFAPGDRVRRTDRCRAVQASDRPKELTKVGKNSARLNCGVSATRINDSVTTQTICNV